MDHKAEDQTQRKVRFYDEMASEWNLESPSKIIVSLGDFNGHVGKCVEGFAGVHGGKGIGKRNAEGWRLLGFCDEKELCMANTWFYSRICLIRHLKEIRKM